MKVWPSPPSSSIGKKLVMALTGLLLIGFLLSHLAGNFLLFAGAEVYNTYSHKLVSNPLIYGAEAFLVTVFLYHVYLALKVSLGNRRARAVQYNRKASLGEKTLASSTMMWSGVIIFVFVILHLISFKFGTDVSPPSSEGVRDLHSLVIARFQNEFYSLFYLFCFVVLAFHLGHAIQSSMRTLGVSHPKYLKYIGFVSYILSLIIALGYSIFPIYFGFLNRG